MAKITVTQLVCSSNSITISWRLGTRNHQSILYRRSDGTWRFDPDTRKLPSPVIRAIERCMMRKLTASPSQERPSKPLPPQHHDTIKTWFS